MMGLKAVVFRALAASRFDQWLPLRHASIMMYHGVLAPGESSSSWTQVPVDQFRRQMEYLAGNFKPVSLLELVDCLLAGRPFPHRAFAVTFDDGLLNNFEVAVPILRELKIPATFFSVSSFIAGGELLWIDRVHLVGRHFAGRMVEYAEWKTQLETLAGKAMPDDPHELAGALKGVPAESKARIMDVLDGAFPGLYYQPEAQPFRPMSLEQMQEMDRDPLFEIGGHTLTHEILAQCSPEEIRRQIVLDKQQHEAWLGHPLRVFAYPNGRECDFNETAVQAAREAGYDAAVTTTWGNVRVGDHRWRLARLGIGTDDVEDPVMLVRLGVTGVYPLIKRLEQFIKKG